MEQVTNWRKASYSGTNGGNCVEVGSSRTVVVRDTADRKGPFLVVKAGDWRSFIENIKGR
jgi:Domain of unknown function (DUF397)